MLSNVTCSLITTPSEKEKAAGIVDKKYREEGYIRGEEKRLSNIASYLQEGRSEVFGVFADNEMYGTLSLIFDGGNGFPMDSIYKEEVDTLRKHRYKIGEVVQFAVDKDISKKHLSFAELPVAAVPLFGYLLSYAKKNEFDYLCISVNPKHVSFYALVGFEKLGEVKQYASVDAPAVAMSLSMKEVTRDSFGKNSITRMIKTFFTSYEDLV